MANKGALHAGLLVFALGVSLVVVGCSSRQKTAQTPPPDVTTETPSPTPEPSRGVPETEPMRVYELSDIHFDFDRYDLRSGDKTILTNHGKWLTDNGNVKVTIEGHCDERGTVEYNLALGEKRARTARDFLVSYGITEARLDIISYGKERPEDPRHNEEAWATNRRCHFVKR